MRWRKQRRARRLPICSVTIILVLGTACGPSTPDESLECDDANDCPSGWYCVIGAEGGRCSRPPEVDAGLLPMDADLPPTHAGPGAIDAPMDAGPGAIDAPMDAGPGACTPGIWDEALWDEGCWQ